MCCPLSPSLHASHVPYPHPLSLSDSLCYLHTRADTHTQWFSDNTLCHWAHIDSGTVSTDLITHAAYKYPTNQSLCSEQHEPARLEVSCLTILLKHKAFSAFDHTPEPLVSLTSCLSLFAPHPLSMPALFVLVHNLFSLSNDCFLLQ